MTRINNFFLNIVARAQAAKNEEGQGTVEYILVAGIITVAVVGAVALGIDDAIADTVSNITNAINGEFV